MPSGDGGLFDLQVNGSTQGRRRRRCRDDRLRQRGGRLEPDGRRGRRRRHEPGRLRVLDRVHRATARASSSNSGPLSRRHAGRRGRGGLHDHQYAQGAREGDQGSGARPADGGLFDLQVNGSTQADDVGDAGTTDYVNVGGRLEPDRRRGRRRGHQPGRLRVLDRVHGRQQRVVVELRSALARRRWPPGDVVDCTITNTRKPRVTVTKDLVPSGDGGLFDLQVNGSTQADDVGDAGTTGSVNVAVGSNPTVGEVAGAGTTLADYESSIECTGDSTASSSNSGPLSLGDAGRRRCGRLHDHEQAQGAREGDQGSGAVRRWRPVRPAGQRRDEGR